MNVLVIGKIPPPVGGVSVFVKRTVEKYENNGHAVDCIHSINIKAKILFNLCFKKYDLIVVNTSSIAVFAFLFFLRSVRYIDYVDHNHSRHWKLGIKREILFYFLSKVKTISVVNDHLINNYPIKLHSSIEVINPYIKPSGNSAQIKSCFGRSYENFVSEHDKLILISAWRLIIESGEDLYGVDFSISILFELLSSYENIGLIIGLGDSNYNLKYRNYLLDKIMRSGMNNNIFWLLDQNVIWPVYEDVDIYLRPTTTDGNSISIHEANGFNCTVIASNVVPRPDFCRVYSDRNNLLNLIADSFNETNPPKHK